MVLAQAPVKRQTGLVEALRLRRDATLSTSDGGGLTLRQSRFELVMASPGVGRRALMLRLAEHWVSHLDANRLVSEIEGEAQIMRAQVLLRRLVMHCWLDRRLSLPDRPLLEVMPKGLGQAGAEPELRHRPGCAYRMSRFVALRAEDGRMVAHSPLSTLVVGLPDPRVLGALVAAAAADGCDATAFAAAAGVDETAAGRLLDELLTARIVVAAADQHAETAQPPQALWSAEDLGVHGRSRAGRHALPIGGTYRFADRFPAAPLHASFPGRPSVPLPAPAPPVDPGPSFAAVLAERRTIREHDDARPITLAQLGEFLYRVQHTTDIRTIDGHEVGRRPYPSGGGLCELEVYPMVTACAGLAAGLYHYDSVEHRLERLAPHDAVADRLLGYAGAAASLTRPPQVLLVVTARVQRLMWKYEGLGYAMILKNCGLMTELMYLVAAAMGLAPCALGAGDSAAFAALSGLDPLVEPSVADFLLGSRAAA
ncbi:SagB/ThcOx family dehydrogenase [Dactylosporangium sp. CA-233914]|uniref:SagB/ThcOx family dehydrogenase n=1 Tax=Dactylosporangium sp. CA-233914 TaxID=3239934 RepID=UPI003D8B5950